jgi:hypothetical protein
MLKNKMCCKYCGKPVDILGGRYITIALWNSTELDGYREGEILCHYDCFIYAAGEDYKEELESPLSPG